MGDHGWSRDGVDCRVAICPQGAASVTLMRNSSQNAGCIRRSPASHCCHVRQVVCTNAPAAVWDSPAASRAARTSAGGGLDDGPCGPRLGWLGMSEVSTSYPFVGREDGALILADWLAVREYRDGSLAIQFGADVCAASNDSSAYGLGGTRTAEEATVVFCRPCDIAHFYLQPLIPRRGCRLSTVPIIRALRVRSRTI